MKKRNHIQLRRLFSLVILAAIVCGSCQRVINLKLNTAASQVVIEAYVTDQPGGDTVVLSYTGSYFTPGNYPAINGAQVIITDNTGLSDTLLQIDSGVYNAPNLTGIPGRTYTLKAFISGKEFDAVSTMPAGVNIDSLVAEANVSGFTRQDSGDRIRCHFLDPQGITNYYRLQATVNGFRQTTASNITIYTDKFSDGLEENVGLRSLVVTTGDTVKVDLMSIDYNTYNYFSVVRSIATSGNPISTATPQNPPTNIIGGAVGYFSAFSIRSATLVTP